MSGETFSDLGHCPRFSTRLGAKSHRLKPQLLLQLSCRHCCPRCRAVVSFASQCVLKHGGFHILLPTVLNRLQGRAWHILRGNNLLKGCRPTTASAMESHPGQPYARPSCFMLNRHSHPFKAQHVLSLNTEKFKDLPSA